MSNTKDNSITITFEREKIGYMMATRAFHLLGDISSDEPDLCHIYGITENGFYYVGMWELGYGFFNVLFPKETTRPLTDDEVDEWSGRKTQIAHQPAYGYNADDLRASRGNIESLMARRAARDDAKRRAPNDHQ